MLFLLIALGLFLLVTGVLFLQGKCKGLAQAFVPKKDSYDWDKLLRFMAWEHIIAGACFFAIALLWYQARYFTARNALYVFLGLAIVSTVYEAKSKRFRK